jgi:hypothetical protein
MDALTYKAMSEALGSNGRAYYSHLRLVRAMERCVGIEAAPGIIAFVYSTDSVRIVVSRHQITHGVQRRLNRLLRPRGWVLIQNRGDWTLKSLTSGREERLVAHHLVLDSTKHTKESHAAQY